jgi:endogenous inhibitor of DNA gyrase (YacG/DUF329 family)
MRILPPPPVQPPWQPPRRERCKLQDLAKWIDGAYRVPAEPLPDADDELSDDTDHHS